MIEATCSACGTLNRIVETDVPAGAKFVACASCKSRLPLPNNTIGNAAPLRPAASTLDLSDLPAPKRPPALGPAGAGTIPPPRPLDLGGDLPAPKLGPAGASGTPPLPRAINLDGDLPAPKPGAKATMGGLPKPPPPQNNALNLDDFLAPAEPDLPAPKPRGRPTELPATKAAEDILDLPAPRASRGVTDLPAPKGPILGMKELPRTGVTDLPAPKGAGSTVDLPMPKGPAKSTVDLPMPKGKGSTDLPQPKGSLDLPAPKGFFDDLPQPSRNQAAGGVDLPAPKGFFDDLPQVAKNQGSQDLPAPLGFFDDLPQKAKGGDVSVPAPKGYFEDLPQRAKQTSQPGNEVTPLDPSAMELDVADSPSLDLAPSTPLTAGNYNDIEIAKPSTPPTRFNADVSQRPTQVTGEAGIIRSQPAQSRGIGAGGELELEADPRNRTQQLAQKRKEEAARPVEATKVQRRLSKGALAAVVAGVAVLGGGGFFMYRRHAAAAERQDLIDEQLGKARSALAATDAAHWVRAATAAKNVLEVEEDNPDALEIGAEAAFAGALDDGATAAIRIGRGRKLISEALAAGVSGPPLARAQGLNAITMGQYDISIAKLTPMAAGSKDGFVPLYLGWAQAAKGDLAAAIASFDQAAKLNKALAPSALYGRGKAKLAAGDLEGARADFQAVLDIAKDHIPAQVGLAAAQPAAKASQQEADLLAILQRKDITLADPRAVVGAWVLAGDDAARGSRTDAARERYRKALEIAPADVGALTGLAEVDLKDGKLDVAQESIVKALDQAKDDAHAQIVATELAVKQNRLDDADERIRALSDRKPPLPPLDQAHLMMAKGHLLEAQHKDADAVEAFVAGAKLAGDLDLAPTMAAVKKLVDMNQQARVAELLAPLESKADGDPQLSLTLGNGYLQAGIYDQAEKWLRKASDARPTDPDAMYQLAKAMAKNGKVEDAVAQLKRAMEIDPSRLEFGLELARTYEEGGRDADAGALYDKLLTAKDVGLELRARAGKYFARTGAMEKAAEQGAEILKVDPNHAAGLYLKGEGLLALGHGDEARKAFHAADTVDRDPQYFDGEGRAAEKIIKDTGDTKWVDVALNVYNLAHQGAPKMFNPLAGTGRMYLSRREWKKAADALTEAWKLKEDGDVAFMLGVCAQELLDNKTAMAWLKQAQQLKPLPEASNRLGLLLREANDSSGATDAFRRATTGEEALIKKTGVKSPPWLMEAYYQLGYLLNAAGQWHEARVSFERWQQLGPPQDARYQKVTELLGTALRGK